MSKMRRTGLILLIVGYMLAGINHFVNPAFYVPIIPSYIPFPVVMNYAAGCFEIVFALMLVFPKSRPLAAWGIALMLTVFLTVHIDMLRKAPYQVGKLNIKLWAAWLRLALQPVLMWWAWLYTKPAMK